MTALISKPGITSVSTLSIPVDWDKVWFRNFIQNQLKGADVRNAIGANGITITGNISTPYATIGISGPATITGPITINATGSNIPLYVMGTTGSGQYAMRIDGGGTSGDLGLNLRAGFAVSGDAINVANAAHTHTAFQLSGDGHFTFNGSIANSGLSMNAAGNVVIGVPASGVSLAINSLVVCSVASGAGNAAGWEIAGNGNTISSTSLFVGQDGFGTGFLDQRANAQLIIRTNETNRIVIAAGGSVTVVGALGVNNLSPPAQVTGWGTPAGPAVVATFPATPTLAQCGQAIGEIIVALKNFGLFGA